MHPPQLRCSHVLLDAIVLGRLGPEPMVRRVNSSAEWPGSNKSRPEHGMLQASAWSVPDQEAWGMCVVGEIYLDQAGTGFPPGLIAGRRHAMEPTWTDVRTYAA